MFGFVSCFLVTVVVAPFCCVCVCVCVVVVATSVKRNFRLFAVAGAIEDHSSVGGIREHNLFGTLDRPCHRWHGQIYAEIADAAGECDAWHKFSNFPSTKATGGGTSMP